MEFEKIFYVVILIVGSHGSAGKVKQISHNDAVLNQTAAAAYNVGVHMGIINPEKYSFEAFERDERNIFRNIYAEYISLKDSQWINYEDWLVMNNFGILADTQESLFEKKISIGRSSRKRFRKAVKKGDILITSEGGVASLIGHAAIMVSNNWVLEMKGGKCWKKGIKDNNRQLSKDDWFDKHRDNNVIVYRCPDKTVADEAAIWADRNYFNPKGLGTKEIHINFKITPDFTSTNPSYSSKLVLQAYFFGPKTVTVIEDPRRLGTIIVPTNIPAYFIEPYKLKMVGKF